MNSSDSAEEIVRLSLDGMEVAFKIAGAGAKNIAVAIYAIMKNHEKVTKGKTKLTNMLKTNKPLRIFTIKAEDLKTFAKEADGYGISYCALANKKNTKIDGMVDIMVKEEDAPRINRVAERFNFKDVATIKKELEQEKQSHNQENSKENNSKSKDEQFIDDIIPKPKEEQKETPSNTKDTVAKNLSEISSDTKLEDKVESSKENKKSVKEELKQIEQELKVKEQKENMPDIATDRIVTKDKKKEAKHYKEKEEKHKGKRYKEPKHLDNTSKSKKRKKNKERSK